MSSGEAFVDLVDEGEILERRLAATSLHHRTACSKSARHTP